jgi:tyrosinase
MPLDSTGSPWYYTPADVRSTDNLKYNGSAYSYTYDDLSLTSFDKVPPAQSPAKLIERFSKLGISDIEKKSIQMANKKSSELVGASTGSIKLSSNKTDTSVKLNKTAWKSVRNSLTEASFLKVPDEVFLQLEGVKGGSDSNFLSVYVNQKFVKSVSLFGLLNASMKNTAHSSGAGLTFKFNITNIIDDLHLDGNVDVGSLDVQIKSKNDLPDNDGITIDRIGIYRASS